MARVKRKQTKKTKGLPKKRKSTNPNGAPAKLSAQLITMICRCYRLGMPKVWTARRCGISYDTLASWHRRAQIMVKEEALPTTPHEKLLLKFLKETDEARAQIVEDCLEGIAKIGKGKGKWQAYSKILHYVDKENFGSQLEVVHKSEAVRSPIDLSKLDDATLAALEKAHTGGAD